MSDSAERPTNASAYAGYAWIKVPKYTMNEAISWEDRYKELERHHIQETTFLINKIRELAAELDRNSSAKISED